MSKKIQIPKTEIISTLFRLESTYFIGLTPEPPM
jgi:hypothetical protein